MKSEVHVAIIRSDLSDEYNRHTGATMMSVMDNCSVPVVFHLIHEKKNSDENPEKRDFNIKRFEDLVEMGGGKIYFHNVTLPEWINENKIPAIRGWSPTGFYRFYLPELLPGINKVISLGSDVIVKTDLKKLYEMDLDNYSIAGILDKGIPEYLEHTPGSREYYDAISVPTSSYINADVLIFNLDKIRKEKTLPQKALEFLDKHNDVPHLDQDVFNAIFRDDMHILPERYNIMPIISSNCEIIERVYSQVKKTGKADYILHFAGPQKPWEGYHSKYEYEYWNYLYRTPWGEEDVAYDYFEAAIKGPKSTLQEPKDVIMNIDEYIWRYPLLDKIKMMWRFTIPLYIKIMKRYLK